MTVHELIEILNKVEYKEFSEIEFYIKDEEGNEVDLDIKNIGTFSISTDIVIEMKKVKRSIIKPSSFKTSFKNILKAKKTIRRNKCATCKDAWIDCNKDY